MLVFSVGMTKKSTNDRTQILEHIETKKPRLFRVMLLNDDYTPMDFVVMVLMRYFHKSAEDAITIMLSVHHKGRGVAGVYPRDIAETKVHEVAEHARKEEFPLVVVMEPE